MRRFAKTGLAGLTLFCLAMAPEPARTAFEDISQGVRQLFVGNSLSQGEISAGLKDALLVGTAQAVEKTGRIGGYLNNPKIRIPLPGPVSKTEQLLRFAGYGSQVDEFSQSVNRAAEKAAPQAGDLFRQAIHEMTIEDARQLWSGGDTAATDYFREKTGDRLRQIFMPVIHDSLMEVGATRKYQELDNALQTLPFGKSLNLDLDSYVTEGALKGLFVVVAEEERKIRRDPAARTTELLKQVFGAAH